MDTLTQPEANEIIHRWMGKCWHEIDYSNVCPVSGEVSCKHCKEFLPQHPDHTNPDYFTPQGFFEIKERLVEIGRWYEVKQYIVQSLTLINCHADWYIAADRFLDYRFTNPDSLPWKLVEWVREEGE